MSNNLKKNVIPPLTCVFSFLAIMSLISFTSEINVYYHRSKTVVANITSSFCQDQQIMNFYFTKTTGYYHKLTTAIFS